MTKERFTLRAAVYLILLKDDKVLLQRRFNTGWMDGMYSLIAGHIDGNESVVQAIIREAKEEADITLKKESLLPATVIHRGSPDQEYIDFFFVAKQWEGTPIINEADKSDDLSWFRLDSLPENLLPYIREALNNYTNKIPFSISGWE